MRLLSERCVDRILPIELAIESAREAFRSFSNGSAQVPLRSEIHRNDPRGTVLVMPGLIGDHTLGVKLVGSVFTSVTPPVKATTCMMLIWDARNLRVRGLIAADRLNEHRTAAGFAAATDLLAPADARDHLVIGAGKLAFTAALHVAQVRPGGRIMLLSRTRERVERLAAQLRAEPRLKGCEVITNLAPDEAVLRARIITTVTTASEPVFDGRAVQPGTHINLGGGGRVHEREMDDHAAARATVWVDSMESCRARSGDLVLALQSGALTEDRLRGEIGQLLLGQIPGRQSPAEVTVFKSLGIATQDLVLGARLLDLAEAQGLGQAFDEREA
jgi:ornithine cyclodeaminase